MKRNHFKIDVSLNFGKTIDLNKEAKKLVESAEDFSKACKYRKVMTLLSLEQNIISFMLAFNTKEGYEKVTIRFLTDLLKRICSIFNMTYDSKKKYFSIETCLPLSHEQYLSFYGEAMNFTGSILFEDKESNNNEKTDSSEEAAEACNKTENNASGADIISDSSIKIPSREFPVLLSGNARYAGNDKREGIDYPTLKATMEQLNNLVGLEEVKKQISQITSFIIRNNEKIVSLNVENPGLYFNVAICGGKGSGKSRIAKLLYHIYYHLGAIGKGKFITVDAKDFYPSHDLSRELGNAQSGVVLIDNAHLISTEDEGRRKDSLTTLDDWFTQYKDNFIFILAGEYEGVKELLKKNKIKKHMNFFIDIPDFTEGETLKLVQHFARNEKLTIEKQAEAVIINHISYLKENRMFENAYAARMIVERAIIKNGSIDNSNVLVKENFSLEDLRAKDEKEKTQEAVEIDPFKELEAMIGLEQVKEKVKEISAYAAVQLQKKNLGLTSEPLCMHMCFTGNPGSGKTTVARCIGRILNKLGVLSTGKFVEVARENLIAKYVGHTALKTAERIKEAEGGVLFIDEAYSLESDSRVDFGYEAVTTMVKKMEDLRGNIVMIFAGYPREMSKFINMNPGLKDRIQFNIGFPDYKAEELMEIWMKFFNDNQYKVEEGAFKEMEKISSKLHENKNANFSNGRMVRKLFERVKMHQAVRLMNESLTGRDELVKITAEDIKCLYKEQDIKELLQEIVMKTFIGFAR